MNLPIASLNGLATGLFLLSAFGSLATRQIQGCVRFFRLQSFALAASIFLLAMGTHVSDLVVVAVVDLALKPLLIPWLLKRYVRGELFRHREIEQLLNIPSSLLIGLFLTLTAYLSAPLLPLPSAAMGQINLPIGLAGLLVGVYTLAVRVEALPQLIGLFGVENAALLIGVAVAPNLPVVADMAFAFDMVVIAVVIGILTRITHERVGSTEIGAMRALKEVGIE